MRPTRACLTLALAAAICIGLGVLFGRQELFLLGGVCITSILVAAAYVLFAPLDLSVQRETSPAILRVGTQANVSLTLHNKGRLRTPVLKAIDHLERYEGAAVHIAPIRPGQTAVVKYEVPAEKRGEITFGPFDIVITDPFGLIKTKVRAAEAVKTVVRAQLTDLAPVQTLGGELIGDFSSTQKLSASGDEFVRLRPYVVGDELRRVHWRASARTGDLVVRQNEETRTGVLSVLFDVSSSRYSSSGFERAVSTTLSAVRAGVSSDDDLQYLTSATPPTRVNTTAELNAIDLQLALLQPSDSGSLASALGQLTRRSRSGGTLILVTGHSDIEIERIMATAKSSFGQILAVLCDPTDPQPSFWHIRNDGTTDLSLGWTAALQGQNQ